MVIEKAREVVRRCRSLAEHSEEPGATTRTFLSAPMRAVHSQLTEWMTQAAMSVRVDAAGNIRGVYPARSTSASSSKVPSRLFLGSHLDTVPHAGAFDGVLGVVMAIALVELLDGDRLPFEIEIVGFSEEEGVRFGVPFIGSRALAGLADEALLERRDEKGCTVSAAIRNYGLDPTRIADARAGDGALGYLEFHIEQGPVLDNLGLPLGIVTRITGHNRFEVTFEGTAGHAGTTPMDTRRDALAGAAEWITVVEHEAKTTTGLVATVGRVVAEPGADNVIAGKCRTSLDIRHVEDSVRIAAVDRIIGGAQEIASRRSLTVHWESHLAQASVPMDPWLMEMLERSVRRLAIPVHRMPSGAGHDAMIMAARMPAAMLFLRSPRGISHHPDESIIEEDVATALKVGRQCLDEISRSTS
jgi:allantoate deiminase